MARKYTSAPKKTITYRRLVRMRRAHKRQHGEMPDIQPRRLPRTRAECVDGPRPCPFLTCRHHLALDVTPSGSLRITNGNLDDPLQGLSQTCSLDLATEPHMIEELGAIMGLKHQRVQQEIQAAIDVFSVVLTGHKSTFH